MILFGEQRIEDLLILDGIASVDIQLRDTVLLNDHVVEAQPAYPRARPKPVVCARLDVGMTGAAFSGNGNKPFPEMKANIVSFGPLSAALLFFLTQLDLVVVGFRQRNDLLHVHHGRSVVEIRAEPDAANVDVPVTEP